MKNHIKLSIVKSVSAKVVLTVITLLLMGVILLIDINLKYYQENVENLASRLIQSNMKQIGNQIETIYIDMMRLASVISEDDTIRELAIDNKSTTLDETFKPKKFQDFSNKDYYRYSRLVEKIKYYRSNFLFNYEDAHITIITAEGFVCTATNVENTPNPKNLLEYYNNIAKQKWYLDALKSQDRMTWVVPFEYSNNVTEKAKYITVICKINDGYSNDEKALLLIHVNLNTLNAFFPKEFSANSYLFDSKGDCVFEKEWNLKGNKAIGTYNSLIENVSKNEMIHEYNFDHFGLKMVSIVHSLDAIVEQGNQFMYRYISISVIVWAIITFLIAMLVTHMMRPLQQLIKRVRSGEYGNFHVDESVKVGDIQSIVDGFESMMRENSELNNNILMEQKTEFQLRYDMLKAQINPHFLFNTLNVIKFKAIIDRNTEVSEMLANLGALLEASMARESEIITIESEIKLLYSYIAIQNVRFKDAFKFEVFCEEEAKSCQIIKLLLQPIVENSITHGFKVRPDNAIISITIVKINNKIMIKVGDNGIGMSEERAKEVVLKMNENHKGFSGIGLYNINQRIQYSYGYEYGVTISSIEGKGTTVEVLLPAVLINQSGEADKI